MHKSLVSNKNAFNNQYSRLFVLIDTLAYSKCYFVGFSLSKACSFHGFAHIKRAFLLFFLLTKIDLIYVKNYDFDEQVVISITLVFPGLLI